MKIFKKGSDFDSATVDPATAAAPPASAGAADNDITDLVDWYLNPDAPSPVVDHAASKWS